MKQLFFLTSTITFLPLFSFYSPQFLHHAPLMLAKHTFTKNLFMECAPTLLKVGIIGTTASIGMWKIKKFFSTTESKEMRKKMNKQHLITTKGLQSLTQRFKAFEKTQQKGLKILNEMPDLIKKEHQKTQQIIQETVNEARKEIINSQKSTISIFGKELKEVFNKMEAIQQETNKNLQTIQEVQPTQEDMEKIVILLKGVNTGQEALKENQNKILLNQEKMMETLKQHTSFFEPINCVITWLIKNYHLQ